MARDKETARPDKYGFKSKSEGNRFNTLDNSKLPYKGAQFDFRVGEDDIGMMLNLEPYESGYCFLAVMGTPRFMWSSAENPYTEKRDDRSHFARRDNRDFLLDTFIRTLEKEFSGLSGIEDQTLDTNDISNNITNIPVVNKTSQATWQTVTTNYTEKSGLPITKFLDMYHRYIYDPATNVKTYGGMRKLGEHETSEQFKNGTMHSRIIKNVKNETFSLLYVITDRTCLLVEKAFILYNAYPINTSWSTIADNNKFEVDKKEISINWQCQVLDGALANRLGTIYVRKLYKDVLQHHLQRGMTIQDQLELDWHFGAEMDGKTRDIYCIYDLLASDKEAKERIGDVSYASGKSAPAYWSESARYFIYKMKNG